MKHQPYSRRVLGDRFDTWSARNRRPLVIVGAAAVLALVAVTVPLILGGVSWPWAWYAAGVFHALVVGGYVALILSMFMASERDAIRHVRGAWGEDNTRDLLRQARRQGLIWGWVDGIELERGDLDHLVVTRHGGLVAMDSKWRSGFTQRDAEDLEATARRMKLRAQGVVETLLRSGRGDHRARGASVRVTPLIVVWGAAQNELSDPLRLGEVELVTGQGLLAWLRRPEGESVDHAAARDLLTRLEDFRDNLATRAKGAR